MSSEDKRVAVKTYVPAYQKKRWREHADQLGMSQSEFLRTMVQAGRRGFDLAEKSEEGGPDTTNPGGNVLESRIHDLLESEGTLDWDELREELAVDLEDRMDEALSALQDRNQVKYSGRDGGYTLTDEGGAR
ncbi:hypothetical protein AArcSl_2356 [Halalkaliarchaeum desulfuricum]|uniref:Uncharacterized protein n=1 Tax=Halalkaliarchaeum desulfuricum TaxID=2055893 RepID=A0A343TLK6_9EURY|nr:DUF5805 domain-containing protein [Halalkaliarchaeum desulfuricum]AUX09978.1 hypothetical protein AArcSl_2356 [Halalkaliarchaeum desulfuricum]